MVLLGGCYGVTRGLLGGYYGDAKCITRWLL